VQKNVNHIREKKTRIEWRDSVNSAHFERNPYLRYFARHILLKSICRPVPLNIASLPRSIYIINIRIILIILYIIFHWSTIFTCFLHAVKHKLLSYWYWFKKKFIFYRQLQINLQIVAPFERRANYINQHTKII